MPTALSLPPHKPTASLWASAVSLLLAASACSSPSASRAPGARPTAAPTRPAQPGRAPARRAVRPRRDPTRTARPPSAPRIPWTFDWARATNRSRLGRLTPRQQSLLRKNGFFLAPQPARTMAQRATHLFHVYERNDYIRFPSFVTVDLAIDLTHAFFNAVLREVEERQLAPRLEIALRMLQAEALRLRARARDATARRLATRTAAFWATALTLLRTPAPGDPADAPGSEKPSPKHITGQPRPAAPLPPPVGALVRAAVARIWAGRGRLPRGLLRAPVDLTQMRPRGHYAGAGRLRRYFRTMSFLGMAAFPVTGRNKDVAGVTGLARTLLGVQHAAETLRAIRQVTAFFAGGPDAADIFAAARRLRALAPAAAATPLERLLAPELQRRYAASLAQLPPPRIRSTASGASAPVQVRVLGRRAFEDNVALQRVLSALEQAVRRDRRLLVRGPGALGAAAVLGSRLATRILTTAPGGTPRPALRAALARGAAHIRGLPPTRWREDAYHGTLHALVPLIAPPGSTAPRFLRTPAWQLRALQAFAAGWAELRHDTILYGEQSGAECDAPTQAPPPGWVEPLPEVYRRLADVVSRLHRRLGAAGIPTARPSAPMQAPYAAPLATKVKQLTGLLRFLETVSRQELAGQLPNRKQRERLTLIGGEVEWLLISLANKELLSNRDQDMAVVADVFTWRSAGRAVQVAVAHPDLIYAIVPGPGGPVIARGAVMSYREFLQPTANRMTDAAWRARLARRRAPKRPDWLSAIYAEPVPAIRLVGRGVDRCGPNSGAGYPL